ncbi:hypothetical protein NL676_023264 [Syzygium grande]|nr:hypothetical protein NL676_023264 [Syzygium grande]
MSQEQPRRPQGGAEPIQYGDVFDVSGKLQAEPIAPQDTATMQAAENMVLGQTRKGGITAVMQVGRGRERADRSGEARPGEPRREGPGRDHLAGEHRRQASC